MHEIVYGRSPEQVEDDFILEILDLIPEEEQASELEKLMEMTHRQLISRLWRAEKEVRDREEREERRRIRYADSCHYRRMGGYL